MSAWLPDLHAVLGLAGTWVVLLVFLALGSAVTARRMLPEVQLIAGWGLVCLVLTVWGVATPLVLGLPVIVLSLLAAACLFLPRLRSRVGDLGGVGRLLLLSVPLWLLLLPIRPSQFDTWVNLLPNAAYLFNHDLFPMAARPEAYSFLPVAPYNSQFAAYMASIASGSFAESAMSWFNVALLLAAALFLARHVIEPGVRLSWWAVACGALLAVPLNPGFVPRAFFSAYGEPSLAVTAMFALALAADLLDDLARGEPWPRAAGALALVLAALVNIKQSGIGLLAPIGGMTLLLALLHPAVPKRRAIVVIALVLAPSIMLYALWRWFAIVSFVAGELKPMPMSAWNWALLPVILWSMARQMFQKAAFFIPLFGLFGLTIAQLRRAPWTRHGLLLALIAGTTVLFNGFLLFTYIAHFPPGMARNAHSYFRYNSQLSLALMLGLLIALRPSVAAWLQPHLTRWRRAPAVPVVLILVLPIGGASLLRFDLDPPQPVLWDLGHAVSARLAPDTRLGLLVPGDVDDAVGSLLRGVIMFTPPVHPALEVQTRSTATAADMDALAKAGFTTALVSCTPADLPGVPAGVAALLRFAEGRWTPEASWPYPPDLRHQHFAGLLTAGPLCAAPR